MGELENICILAVIICPLSMPNITKREQPYSTNDVFAEIIMTVSNIIENNKDTSADSICRLKV